MILSLTRSEPPSPSGVIYERKHILPASLSSCPFTRMLPSRSCQLTRSVHSALALSGDSSLPALATSTSLRAITSSMSSVKFDHDWVGLSFMERVYSSLGSLLTSDPSVSSRPESTSAISATGGESFYSTSSSSYSGLFSFGPKTRGKT